MRSKFRAKGRSVTEFAFPWKMDDDVADLVTDELRHFFISITKPFLGGLSEEDKYNARSWTQRVMHIRNYPLMKNYLILLSYMIFSGRVVSPFDVDCRKSKLPKIPACLQEDRLFEYVQSEIERRNREDVLQATESALSRDEMAFLAQLPVPKGGIRLYLAASDTPYQNWSKANKFPPPTKYDVSAQDFTTEGLDLVRKKFEESEIRRLDERRHPARITDVTEKSHNSTEQVDDMRIPNRHNDSSAYEYDSMLNSPTTKEPRVQVIGRKKPEIYKCTVDIAPGQRAVIEDMEDVVVDDLLDSPPRLITDEEFQKEQKVLQKVSRWFSDPIYYRYIETIKKLLRRKVPVDTIRRNIHRCMRQRYKPGTTIPNWLRDSLDEAEPWHMRIAHLKMRLSDVLKNEYGVVDEDELFHLSNTPALSENDECKARELIRRAEEDRIDPAVKNKFVVEENRSCKRLMNIIDEILNSDYDPEAPPRDLTDQRSDAEAKPWRCNLETSHSVSRKSYEASQMSRRQSSLQSSRLNAQGGNAQNGEDCVLPNECCPPDFKVDPVTPRQDVSNCTSDREAPREASSQDFQFSNNSQLRDFDIENEKPDDLFANLPPDSSIDDGSVNQSRRNNDSSNRNSK